MKKIKYLLFSLALLTCVMLINLKNVSASELEKNDFCSVRQEGVISIDNTNIPNNVDLSRIDEKIDKLIGYSYKIVVTTYVKNALGDVIEIRNHELTPDEELTFEEDGNYYVTHDNKLIKKESNAKLGYDDYSTTNKKVEMYYATTTSGQYYIQLSNTWLNQYNPNVRSYDIIAARWTNSISTSNINATGTQVATNNSQNYSNGGSNMVKSSNGVGISMNLFDSGLPVYEMLKVYSPTAYGTIYGTYQHATTNVSLATSKSYYFGNGLGGTIVHSYSGYYDGMPGVSVS